MWESITILMGPPGSGKTTVGKHVASITENVFFISVGEYMRDKLCLKPPFHNVNRTAIFEKIIFTEFGNTEGKHHLLIDCNPFPAEMWAAVSEQLVHFKKTRLLSIDAKPKTLQKRLDSRARKDHQSFSNKERLDYYFKNVEPVIKKMGSEKIIEFLQNDNEDDYKKCIEITLKAYEKS